VTTTRIDAVTLAQDLIRQPSVTPDPGTALDVLQAVLDGLGFVCHRLTFSEDGTEDVPNLYARFGTASPNFCYAGHTDVVPPGPEDQWTHAPYAAVIEDGVLWGRGAADMKASIACFAAAAASAIQAGRVRGSLSFLITGDEEGVAVNGTKKVLDWLKAEGEHIDLCLVGEPTNPLALGDMIKIGRRGSMHGHLTVTGTQGHVAYPDRAHNPIPDLVALLAVLDAVPIDGGNAHFQPSNLEMTDVHVGNDVSNVIPGKAEARFNIRFNSDWTPESLQAELVKRLDSAGVGYTIDWWVSGESFLTPPGLLSDAVRDAVAKETGRTPELSTTGGTSDARFIKDMCPVVEFGLVGQTMHKVDERVDVADIQALTRIYSDIIDRLVG